MTIIRMCVFLPSSLEKSDSRVLKAFHKGSLGASMSVVAEDAEVWSLVAVVSLFSEEG